MKYSVAGIFVIYVLLAGVEVLLHWCAGSPNGPFSQWIRDSYLYSDPQNHKQYVAGLVDFVFPAVVLGVSIGTFSKTWNIRDLTLGVLLLSAAIVGLSPLYSELVTAPVSANLFTAYLKSVVFCGVLAYGQRKMLQRRMP